MRVNSSRERKPTLCRLKTAAAAASLSFGAAFAPMAQAATVILDVGQIDHYRSVYISGLAGAVLDAPMHFTALYGGKVQTLLAWCVDVYHEIRVQDYSPNLIYTDSNTLQTDFGAPAKALSAADIRQVGMLANYGSDIFKDVPQPVPAFTEVKPVRAPYPVGATTAQKTAINNTYNAALATYNAHKATYTAAVTAYNAAVAKRWTILSAVQGAIWQVVSDRDVTSTNHDAAFDALVDNLSGASFANYFLDPYGKTLMREGTSITLITPVQQYDSRHRPLALTQSFVFGTAPEPAGWALMILGFGAAGAALRRRRASPAAA